MRRRRIAIAALLVSAGCAPASVNSAILNSIVAAGASVARRTEGECYAPCNPGTRCNPDTGLCERIPCGGQCAENQYCDETGLVARCVFAGEAELRALRPSEKNPEVEPPPTASPAPRR